MEIRFKPRPLLSLADGDAAEDGSASVHGDVIFKDGVAGQALGAREGRGSSSLSWRSSGCSARLTPQLTAGREPTALPQHYCDSHDPLLIALFPLFLGHPDLWL